MIVSVWLASPGPLVQGLKIAPLGHSRIAVYVAGVPVQYTFYSLRGLIDLKTPIDARLGPSVVVYDLGGPLSTIVDVVLLP